MPVVTRAFASLIAFALVALAPALAAAQQDRGTVYISAGTFAAIEQAPSSSGLAGVDSDTGGTVPGGMLGVGVHLTPRVSARVEWSITGELDIAQSYAYPAQLQLAPGVSSSMPISDLSIYAPGIESRRRTTSGYALLGYHVTGRRLGLEVLGGVGLVNEDTTSEYDVRILARSIFPSPMPELKTSAYHAVAVVGADLAVSLTRRAAVVPSVRAYALNGGLSVRPGVSLRWTF
jgi:hypothetical protein